MSSLLFSGRPSKRTVKSLLAISPTLLVVTIKRFTIRLINNDATIVQNMQLAIAPANRTAIIVMIFFL